MCVCVCWAPKPKDKSLPFVELKVGVFIRLEASSPLLFSHSSLTSLPLPVLTLLSQSQGTGSHFKTAKSMTEPHVFPTRRMPHF